MEISNLRTPVSAEVASLQDQLRSLESQLREKNAYINTLEKLDSICRSIPTWQSDVATVNEIREDVVCSLENVETILNELLARRDETDDSIITKSQELYRLATGNTGVSSAGTNLSSVTSLLNQTLNQLHAANLYDLSV